MIVIGADNGLIKRSDVNTVCMHICVFVCGWVCMHVHIYDTFRC